MAAFVFHLSFVYVACDQGMGYLYGVMICFGRSGITSWHCHRDLNCVHHSMDVEGTSFSKRLFQHSRWIGTKVPVWTGVLGLSNRKALEYIVKNDQSDVMTMIFSIRFQVFILSVFRRKGMWPDLEGTERRSAASRCLLKGEPWELRAGRG